MEVTVQNLEKKKKKKNTQSFDLYLMDLSDKKETLNV